MTNLYYRSRSLLLLLFFFFFFFFLIFAFLFVCLFADTIEPKCLARRMTAFFFFFLQTSNTCINLADTVHCTDSEEHLSPLLLYGDTFPEINLRSVMHKYVILIHGVRNNLSCAPHKHVRNNPEVYFLHVYAGHSSSYFLHHVSISQTGQETEMKTKCIKMFLPLEMFMIRSGKEMETMLLL